MSENNLAEKMKDTMSEDYDRIMSGEKEDESEVEDDALLDEESEEVEETEDVSEEDTEEDAEEEVEDDVEEAEEIDAEEETAAVEVGEVDKSLVNPPTTWTAAAKAKWDSLDTDIKAEAHKRERDMLKGVNQLKEKASFADRLDQTISPYRPYLTSKNITPERAVADALNLAYTLENSTPQKRGEIIRGLAQQFQADMSILSKEIDPNQQQIMDLQQQIQNMQRAQQSNQQQGQQQHLDEISGEIRRFAEETDQSGRLVNPYFKEVEPLMTSLIASGAASGLQDAYEIAVTAHPDTRALVKATQSKQAAAKRQVDAKKNADKVKRAKSVNIDSTPVDTSKRKAKETMRETLEKEAERLGIS